MIWAEMIWAKMIGAETRPRTQGSFAAAPLCDASAPCHTSPVTIGYRKDKTYD